MLLAVIMAASLIAAQAQQRKLSGHWVNIDPTDYTLLVLAFDEGGVHRLIPAPQFSAKYRIDGERFVMLAGGGPADSSVVIKGDSMLRNNQVVLVRIPDATTTQIGGSQGTWRFTSAASPTMERFMTLRSDGQVVLEVGLLDAVMHGDTLRIEAKPRSAADTVRVATFTIAQDRDTLFVHDASGGVHRLVQKRWGCLGIAQLDIKAAECL